MTVFVAATASVSFASSVTLTPVATPTGLLLRADGIVRWNVDYEARTLIVFEAAMAPNKENVMPEGAKLEARDGGTLAIGFPWAFGVAQSSDGRALTVTRADLAQGPVNSDERFPLVLPLANASPAYVAGVLTRVYNVRVEVDDRQRALLVFAQASDWPLLKSVVAELDRARPQVMFEAEILEVNQYVTQSLGIDYRELFSFNLTEATPLNIIKPGDFTRAPLSIKVGIDLLKTTGSAKTLARPRVATMDGQEARLNATQTTPVLTSGQNGAVNVTNITTGITLRLLPKVAPDGQIESSLSISVSTPTGTNTQGVPSYASREANTTVRVRNGEPIVIGGLLENRNSTASKGLPGLMDVPVLGELFKTTTTDAHFTDLVIVVTPTIVGTLPGSATPASSTPSTPVQPSQSNAPAQPTAPGPSVPPVLPPDPNTGEAQP